MWNSEKLAHGFSHNTKQKKKKKRKGMEHEIQVSKTPITENLLLEKTAAEVNKKSSNLFPILHRILWRPSVYNSTWNESWWGNVQRERKKSHIYLQFLFYAAVAERFCDKIVPIFTALCITNPQIYD